MDIVAYHSRNINKFFELKSKKAETLTFTETANIVISKELFPDKDMIIS